MLQKLFTINFITRTEFQTYLWRFYHRWLVHWAWGCWSQTLDFDRVMNTPRNRPTLVFKLQIFHLILTLAANVFLWWMYQIQLFEIRPDPDTIRPIGGFNKQTNCILYQKNVNFKPSANTVLWCKNYSIEN